MLRFSSSCAHVSRSKAAFLLETLLLDALIARPEAGAGLARTSGGALGRSETLSPRRSPAIASPGGSTVLSGGEGLLSEADQRILQVRGFLNVKGVTMAMRRTVKYFVKVEMPFSFWGATKALEGILVYPSGIKPAFPLLGFPLNLRPIIERMTYGS